MKPLFALVLALLASGCATTEFSPYEARSNAVVEGQGGTKVIVDGLEFWNSGDPPRKFTVVGIIDDERPAAIIPMARLRGDIVKKAREAGGDAVIQLGSQSQIAGYYNSSAASAAAYGNSATASGSTIAMPIRRNTARFVVIKYADGVR